MLVLIIFVSIVTLLVFVQNNKGKDNVWYRLIAGICFTFSWVLLVMWFTVLIENWQIALSTPAATSEFIPSWGRLVQNLLRNVAFLLPASRLGLAVLYGLPHRLQVKGLRQLSRAMIRTQMTHFFAFV